MPHDRSRTLHRDRARHRRQQPYRIGAEITEAFAAQDAAIFVIHGQQPPNRVSVAPDPIQTGWLPPDADHAIVWNLSLCRIGQPAGVADPVVPLASKQPRWVTGQRPTVGGGHRD